MMNEITTIAVLAGGKSTRMGTDKSLVTLDDKTMLQHVVERLQPLGLPVILISNTPAQHAHLGLPMFSDVLPGKGSLGGIYTALHYSQTPYVLCVACDMPFLNPAIIRLMMEHAPGYDIVVPRAHGRLQSLHALYHQGCTEHFRQHAERDLLKIIPLYDYFRTHILEEDILRPLDPDLRAFININTPQDLEALFKGGSPQTE